MHEHLRQERFSPLRLVHCARARWQPSSVLLPCLLASLILLNVDERWSWRASAALDAEKTLVGGEITQDTTWQGEILVTESVVVQPNVTLTILPGTKVRFQHYRGYREPERRLSLIVYGAIHANATALQLIYFTSDAADPQNGDWSMLRLVSPTGLCSFHYVVFEFAQHGLNVWNAAPEISHSVFRWNNWEGVYFESFSQPVILHTQIYENGYNGLAAEQSNTLIMDFMEVWRNGTSGIHIDNSTLTVRQSIIHDNHAHGLSVDDNATMHAYGDAIYGNSACGIGFGEGNNTVYAANIDWKSGNGGGGAQNTCGPVTWEYSILYPPASINIGYTPDMSYALGYIPGDPVLDKYLYVYPDDETRIIIRKIGTNLGLTWSLAWYQRSIWTATLQGTFYHLNAQTGTVVDSFSPPVSPTWGGLSQPWGMTSDERGYLWVVDFAERKIFQIDPFSRQIVFSFPTPNPSQGGCKGLAYDGSYLYVMGWTSPAIYKMDKTGKLIETITLDHGGSGGLAWDEEHFWVPDGGRLLKYSAEGHMVGWIYAASEGTWDMTWDGAYLWATQRTNENWQDAKIFQLQILEDHDHALFLPFTIRN